MASADESGGVVVEKPGWNVYTTMLLISMIALIIGCVCLKFEMDAYKWDINAKNKRSRTASAWQMPAVQMAATSNVDQAIV